MQHHSKPFARLAWAALTACSTAASAGIVDVTVDAAAPWNVYMNVYELPTNPDEADRGGYVFGQYWGQGSAALAAMPASFSNNVVTMAPNVSFAPHPEDVSNQYWAFWWTPDGNGGVTPNKVIEANLYVDSGVNGLPLAGETVRFSGITSASSLAAPYVTYAFIREFTPFYDFIGQTLVPLAAGQAFSVQMDTSFGNAVQYGFALVGPNADPRTVAALGSITVSAVPEPSTLAMLLLGSLAVAARARRQA